jgi:hypothetical protein
MTPKDKHEIEKKEPTKDYVQSNNSSEIKSTKKSFSNIRGLIISGKRNTVIVVLGEPNAKLLGSDYSVKYLHFKLGMRVPVMMQQEWNARRFSQISRGIVLIKKIEMKSILDAIENLL